MLDCENWNWDTGKKLVCDLRAVQDRFDQVHEWAVNADGERIAAPVLTAPDVFRVWVNDALWEGEYEKAEVDPDFGQLAKVDSPDLKGVFERWQNDASTRPS
jgi:hypothetical protein